MGKLVIDGNSVYEIDEECLRKKENRNRNQGDRRSKNTEWRQAKRER